MGSERIGNVEVTKDDCIFRQDLLNKTLLMRPVVVEVFEIKTLCFANLHVFNTQYDVVKL